MPCDCHPLTVGICPDAPQPCDPECQPCDLTGDAALTVTAFDDIAQRIRCAFAAQPEECRPVRIGWAFAPEPPPMSGDCLPEVSVTPIGPRFPQDCDGLTGWDAWVVLRRCWPLSETGTVSQQIRAERLQVSAQLVADAYLLFAALTGTGACAACPTMPVQIMSVSKLREGRSAGWQFSVTIGNDFGGY